MDFPMSVDQFKREMIDIEVFKELSKDDEHVVYWRNEFKMYQDGDKFYEFSTSKKSWEHMYGRAGLALVRGDQVIETVITVEN